MTEFFSHLPYFGSANITESQVLVVKTPIYLKIHVDIFKAINIDQKFVFCFLIPIHWYQKLMSYF